MYLSPGGLHFGLDHKEGLDSVLWEHLDLTCMLETDLKSQASLLCQLGNPKTQTSQITGRFLQSLAIAIGHIGCDPTLTEAKRSLLGTVGEFQFCYK